MYSDLFVAVNKSSNSHACGCATFARLTAEYDSWSIFVCVNLMQVVENGQYAIKILRKGQEIRNLSHPGQTFKGSSKWKIAVARTLFSQRCGHEFNSSTYSSAVSGLSYV